MLRLLLIRHGLTEWNEAGRLMGRMAIGLAPKGRAQIQDLVDCVKHVALDAVVSSPQQRTLETATLIAQPQGLTVEAHAGLDEVWVGPEWQGKTFNEIRHEPDFLHLRRNPTHACSVIEPIQQVQERVVDVVDGLLETGARTIALVSHGDPLRVLLAHFLHISLADYRRLVVDTGSLSVALVGSELVRVPLIGWKPPTPLDSALAIRVV